MGFAKILELQRLNSGSRGVLFQTSYIDAGNDADIYTIPCPVLYIVFRNIWLSTLHSTMPIPS